MFVPTDISEDGQIRGGVFLDRIFRDGKVFLRLEAHGFYGDEYIIENKCFRADRFGGVGKEIPLCSVAEWKDIKVKTAVSGLSKPLFAYFKMPSARADLPMGESVFARSVKLIADAEETEISRAVLETLIPEVEMQTQDCGCINAISLTLKKAVAMGA